MKEIRWLNAHPMHIMHCRHIITTVLALFAELPDLNGIPCLGTQGLTDQKTYDVNPTGSPSGPIDTEPDLEVDTHPDE